MAYAIPDGDGKGNKNENSKLACESKQPEARQLIHSEGRGDHRCDPANHAQKNVLHQDVRQLENLVCSAVEQNARRCDSRHQAA